LKFVAEGFLAGPFGGGLSVRPIYSFCFHRFFLFFLGLGGGASYAVTGRNVKGSSSTNSYTTARCRPVDVQPKTVGSPDVRLTVQLF
jgi:hypothetical protein